MPIQGLQFTILNGQEAHQSYQVTTSFVVYNPNDGVAYIATDRTANGLTWDYKVPSQSGGKFPGPINSYLSIFYLDQSGSGGGGQVVVYASLEQIAVPYFWSIGRALQGQVTSMDVVQGSQPGNPGAGIARLWVDGAGHLHILQSTGTDYQVLDSNNWSTFVTLSIGDVVGPLNNNHIQYRNNSGAWAYDAGGTLRNHLTFGGETLWWAGVGGGFRWVNQGNSVQWMALDTSGNLAVAAGGTYGGGLQVAGSATVAGIISAGPAGGAQAGDISANRGNGTGVIYFGGNHYLYFDGTSFTLAGGANNTINGAFNSGGYINSGSGNYYFSNNVNIFWTWDGNYLKASHNIWCNGQYFFPYNQGGVGLSFDANTASGASIVAGGLYSNGGITAGGRVMAMQAWVGSLTGNTNAFLAPNIADYRGQALAQAHITWSSVDHARVLGLQVADIQDPLALVNSISGYYYAHASMKGEEPIVLDSGGIESNMTYGFAASEVNANIPEMAGDGWVDTSRLIAILWEAVKELDARYPAAPA